MLYVVEDLDRVMAKYIKGDISNWHQVHNISSKKKERPEKKKGGKRNLVDCENIRKGACLIFRSLGGDPLAEDFEPDIFGIPRQETVDHETLHI